MNHVLHINASPRLESSESLRVAEQLVEGLGGEVDRIDLFEADLPDFDGRAVGAKMALFGGSDFSSEQQQIWSDMKRHADRFAAAECYVINTPLWNNGIPYRLKQYIDVITQPGWNFGFDPEHGYTGLLADRRAFVVHASGVYYDGIAPNFGADFATEYLDNWLRFIGVTEIEHVHVAPTVVTPDPAATRADALASVDRLLRVAAL